MKDFTLEVPQGRCAVVEFPGYVRNPVRALEMFGGAEVSELSRPSQG